MRDDFHGMGVRELHAGLASKEFTARELAEATLARIERVDEDVHVFLEVTREAALEAADAADARIAAGDFDGASTLAGIPIGFKDNMNMLGTRTTCASRMLENYASLYDATCVQRAKRAGAVPMGKLNMDEFAFGSTTESSAFGPTHNPWNLAHVPGGSSGGSAAAVAAGMVPVALGTDTGGSIRQPASFCGVVGVKPSYGAVSRYGVVAFGSSLDQVGPLARSVEDAAFVLNAIAGRDEHDCTSQPLTCDFTASLAEGARGMRIGVVPAFMEAAGLSAEVREKVEDAAAALEKLGAEIVEVELPHAQAAISAYYVLGPCEAFSNLARFDSVRYGYREPGCSDLNAQYDASRAAGFGPEARRRILLGSYLLSSEAYRTYYYPAQQVRTLITQDYRQAFGKVDCLLYPVAPTTAFKLGQMANPAEMYLTDMFTISINIAGNGGMSVPVGLGAQTGMPIGVQLVAPMFKDENMLRVGAALETAYGRACVAPAFADGKAGE